MAPKMPRTRGFTVAEKRSIAFERVALWVVFLVAVVAATVSFIALTWVGTHMRLGPWAAPLIPLIIDGFGIACSVGIVRSTAEGKPWRDRASEWVGLFFALGLSVVGNVAHVLDIAPTWLLVTIAVAIPTIVAYAIHVYGRAMVQGLSARIMADDPGVLVVDDIDAQASSATRAEPRRASPAPAPVAASVAAAAVPRAQVHAPIPPLEAARERARIAEGARTPDVARAQDTPAAARSAVPAPARDGASAKAKIEAEVRASYEQDPNAKPDAAALHAQYGLTCNPATSRRWVKDEWDRLVADAAPRAASPEVGGTVIDLDRHHVAAGRS